MQEYSTINKDKQNLRKEILEELRNQPSAVRGEKSGRVQKKLISMEEFKSAKTIMSYVALATEVDTSHVNAKILEMDKRLAVPFIDDEKDMMCAAELEAMENLVRGPYGILVPKDGLDKKIAVEEIDLIIVPGVAFDKQNGRLGRGKGYYDKFLSDASLFFPKTIGLAFQFQVIEALPKHPHDISVSLILTD